MSLPPGSPPPPRPGGWPPQEPWPAQQPTYPPPGTPYQPLPPPGAWQQYPQQFPPPYPGPPQRSLAPLFVVVGVLVVVGAVVIGAVVALSSSRTASSGAAATIAAPTGTPQHTALIESRLRTACTHALAKDMTTLVPRHDPFRDANGNSTGGFVFTSCAANQRYSADDRFFRGLTVSLALFKAQSGLPSPDQQCANDVAGRKPVLRDHGTLKSVPGVGDITVASVRSFNNGYDATVLSCRGGVEVQASYLVSPVRGAPRPESSVLAADVGFVRHAFTDLGA